MTLRYRHLIAAAFVTAAFTTAFGRGVHPLDGAKIAVLGGAGDCPSAAPSATGAPKSNGVKKPIVGLVDLGQFNFSSTPLNTLYFACQVRPAITGLVVNDNWADLQPGGANTPIDTTVIDAALAEVAAYNTTNPAHPLDVRLRIISGIDAPEWAKHIGGPIPICFQYAPPGSPQTPRPEAARRPPSPTSPTPCPEGHLRTSGAWWTTPYQQAWSNVQHQLAAKYDANPLVSEVSVTSCSSFGDEEFLIPIDAWTTSRLLNVFHFTNAAFRGCLAHALDAYSGWHNTIIDDIFNPYYEIALGRRINWDPAFTQTMMQKCVSSLGSRCMLDNQELGKFKPPTAQGTSPPPNVTNLFSMWKYMQTLHAQGVLVTFQTASPAALKHAWGSNESGWNAAVQFAHQFGASSLELWPPDIAALPSPAPGSTSIPCTYPGHPQAIGYTPCFSTDTLLGWAKMIGSQDR